MNIISIRTLNLIVNVIKCWHEFDSLFDKSIQCYGLSETLNVTNKYFHEDITLP